MNNREERIKEIAYRLWEQEGRPDGHSDRLWRAAEAQYEADIAKERYEEDCRPPGRRGSRPSRLYPAAHRDIDPTNNRLRNLRALCQRCHMLHDRPHHLAQRWFTYRRRSAVGDLFLGPCPALIAALAHGGGSNRTGLPWRANSTA